MPWLSADKSEAEITVASILKPKFNFYLLAFSTMLADFTSAYLQVDEEREVSKTKG